MHDIITEIMGKKYVSLRIISQFRASVVVLSFYLFTFALHQQAVGTGGEIVEAGRKEME